MISTTPDLYNNLSQPWMHTSENEKRKEAAEKGKCCRRSDQLAAAKLNNHKKIILYGNMTTKEIL